MPEPLVYLTCVIVLGVAAQWLAWRLKLPAILLLLAAGFALGRWAAPEDLFDREVLGPAISLAVAVILFEGGLSLKLRDLTEIGPAIFRLVTIGCLTTWLLGTLFARLLVFQTWHVAALAGAIYTVTGPTVIGPLLRHIRPNRRVAAVAKWEGIVVDPIGAVLAVLVYEAVQVRGTEAAVATIVWAMFKTIASGLVIGGGMAGLTVLLLRRHWLPDYLHAPALLAAVLGAFTLADLGQHEAGLLAVTVMGVALANQKKVSIEHLTKFKENLGVLLIGVLFIVLSARLRADSLTSLGWQGAAFLAALVFVIRPIAVLLATARSALSWGERGFLAWLAPRGIVAAAVASVFAIELVRVDLEGGAGTISADAARLVPLTFLVIVSTVALYGLTAKPLARRLGIADPDPQGLLILGAGPVGRAIGKAVQEEGVPVQLIDSNRGNVSAARLDGLKTRHGNILSESLQEDVDLGGLGRLLAMTPNDEVNALASLAFVETFERAGVYQLPTPDTDKRRKGEGGANRHTARPLFAPEATYSEISRRLRTGAVVKKTLLTDEFDFKAFQQQHGPRAVVLFVVSKAGKLTVVTADDPPAPIPGQKLISLIETAETPTIAKPPADSPLLDPPEPNPDDATDEADAA